jgi:hypothetical protein
VDGGDLSPDLWEKPSDRLRDALAGLASEGGQPLVGPDGKPRGAKSKRLLDQIKKDLYDRCLICDELITSSRPYRRAYAIYLSRPNLVGEEDVQWVEVHEGCIERGAEIAADQGYGLKQRDPRNPTASPD